MGWCMTGSTTTSMWTSLSFVASPGSEPCSLPSPSPPSSMSTLSHSPKAFFSPSCSSYSWVQGWCSLLSPGRLREGWLICDGYEILLYFSQGLERVYVAHAGQRDWDANGILHH